MGCKLKGCNTMTQNFKHNIKLTGITRVYFTKSEWENLEVIDTISWSYLLYRAVYLTYFLVCLSHSIYRDKTRQFWILMATHWSLIVQTLYGSIFFGNLAYRFYQNYRKNDIRRKDLEGGSGQLRTFDRSSTLLNVWDSVTWLLLNFTGTFPYIVTLGYWGFVFNPDSKSTELSDIMLNLTVHGFNALLALIDIFVIAIPVRIAHAAYTILFTFTYIIFSALYEYSGGEYKNEEEPYIYSFLYWRKYPEWTVLYAFIALFAAFLVHTFMWLLYRLRSYLVSKYPCQSCHSIRK